MFKADNTEFRYDRSFPGSHTEFVKLTYKPASAASNRFARSTSVTRVHT
jgi:hypothetical protein